MAFQYLGSSSTDLFNLVFREILKISPTLLSKYATVQDQIIYLLLIPMAILFLFIYSFSKQIVGRIVGDHRGFEYLVSIIVFIYLVYNGMFGTLLVPLFIGWLNIAIILSLIVFLVSVVMHPARGPALTKLGATAGGMAGKALFEKRAKIKALEDDIDTLKKEIQVGEAHASRFDPGSRAYNDTETKIGQLKMKKKELEHERDKLEG